MPSPVQPSEFEEERFTSCRDIAPHAPRCTPANTSKARLMVERLIRLLESKPYNRHERRSLTRKIRLWRRRAEGRDVRYQLAGNRPGRLPRVLENRIRERERLNEILSQ
jgi:hypothetical protein